MAKEIITAADVLAGKTAGWCYSDAFKEIYGYRPRGEYLSSPEAEADFWNSFEENLQRVEEEAQDHLRLLGEEHGRIFLNWSAYYDFYEAQREAEYRAAEEAHAAREAARLEFCRRGSPQPVIQAWEHGDRLAA